MRRLLLRVVFLVAATCAGAQSPAPVPQVTADELEADFTSSALVYRGNAVARYGDVSLTADELRYRERERLIEARGNVVLTRGTTRLLAAEMTYHLDTRSYRVRDLRFGQLPVYVSGSLVEGAPDELTFHDAVISYGEPGRFAPTVVADRVTYFPERDRMQATGGAVGLGLWQPLPLPSTEIPTDVPFLSYLSLNAGYSGFLGAYAEVGVEVPVGGGFNLGGTLGVFTERGLLAGPSGNYLRHAGTGREIRGEFETGYIHDTGDRLTDIRDEPVPQDRGFVSWAHRQRFGERLSLAALLNYWSDSEVVRDFRPDAFFPVQTPDTFAELTHVSDHVVLGLFARAQVNPDHELRERLPELSFALLPAPLGGELGLYQEAQASVAVLRDDPPAGGPTLRSDRADVYYALTRPFTPREWLTVSPVAGARLTHYARAQGGRSDYTRVLGEFGVDAELRASGTFDYRNERWGIDGLRHLVTPRVSYRYIPDATKGERSIPAIDRRVFATYLEPLGLGSRRQIDDLAATHTLRLALDQRLQTRDPAYGSRDLVDFSTAVDVRFDRAPGDRTLSALHAELRLTPAPWLAFDLYHRADPGSWRTQEFNTGITLRHADQWALRVANHYLDGDIQEHIGAVSYRINEVFELFARVHYDARRDRFNEQRYGINQTLENRWIVGYEVSFFEGPRRESSFGFHLLLDVIAF